MPLIPGVRRLFRLPRRSSAQVLTDVDDELAFHLEQRARELVALGADPQEAQARARREFGDVERARRALHGAGVAHEREARGREWLGAVARDLRLALRSLRRAPGFVAVAVCSLALGIGANAAVFSIVDQLLLRRLPVPHPERLVKLVAHSPRSGGMSCGDAGGCDEVFSYPMFRDLERAQRPELAGLAAHVRVPANLTYGGRTLHANATLVSGQYFPTLGIRPALGRLLGPDDDRTLGAHPVVVLSHAFWRSRLGGDSGVVNRTLIVGGHAMTIVGVAPREFEGTTVGGRPDLFAPLAMTRQVGQSMPGMQTFETNRRRYWLYAFARLAPGATTEDARRAMTAVYRPILADVEAPLQQGLTPEQLVRFRRAELRLEDAPRGQSALADEVRAPLALLSAVAATVLLIACANVANLLLARGATRGVEVAVRVSLGASRRRVVSQLLAESLVLAALGGAAGLLVAHGTLAVAASILPPDTAAAAVPPGLRWPMVACAAALALGTGLVVGLLPALRATRPDLVTTIRAHAGQIAGVRAAARFRTTLVAGQIALSMMLLVAAGLFLKSLRNVARADLGMSADHLVMFKLSPELNGYAPARRQLLFRRVEEALAAVPGVTGVTSARVQLFTGGGWNADVRVEGVDLGPDAHAMINLVGADFFRTLGIPLRAGRELEAADRDDRPRVAVVNEAFVKRFGLGRGAIGRRMAVWGAPSLNIEIVGIAGDAKYEGVKGEKEPSVYLANAQDASIGTLTFYVRAGCPPEAGGCDPASLLRQLPGVVARIDPNVPVQDAKTLPQQLRENVYLDRMLGTLSSAFAALATLLASVGLYGVLAYTVAQRTREIGVRVALGASAGRVRALVMRQVGRMLLAGGAAGAVAALALGRAAGSLLFGLDGHDPAVLGGAAAVVAVVAAAAGYVPARRAARVDPIRALRAE